MNNPRSVLDKRINPRTSNFLFISYCHRDYQLVYADLHSLYEKQLNYWYDKELSGGDKWDEEVKRTINSEECKGAIIYITPESLISEAVEQEIETLFAKQKKDPSFRINIVSLYRKSVMELIRDIFVKMAEFTDKEISNAFPQKRLTNIVTNITNNITYYAPDIQDADAHIYRLCHDLKKFNVPVFSDDESLLEKIKEKLNIQNIDDKLVLDLGCFPLSTTEDELLFNEGISEYKNNKYYTKNKITYLFEKLKWNILQIDKTKLKLCCEQAILSVKVEEIESFFNQVFLKHAFEDMSKIVIDIDVPLVSDLDEIKAYFPKGIIKSKFASHFHQGIDFYICKENDKYRLMGKDFKIFPMPVKNNIEVYVLPVITIDVTDIL